MQTETELSENCIECDTMNSQLRKQQQQQRWWWAEEEKRNLEYIVGSQFMHLKARYAYMLVLFGSVFEFSLPQMQCLTCHYITTNLSLYETHRTSSLSRLPTQCLLLNSVCVCVRLCRKRSLALVCYDSVNWWSSVIAFIRMFEFCLQQTYHSHWVESLLLFCRAMQCSFLSRNQNICNVPRV